MSERWPGGIVRAIPVTPTGPLQNGTAPGVWTLDQANYWIKQGLWPTAGNFLAVEDVFSTWLYTGNGSTQTITNGIDLAGKGGMVWVKNRNSTQLNWTFNSAIGATQPLSTNSTDSAATNIANYFGAANLCVFNNDGFSFASQAQLTTSSNTYASWTFRKAQKFFDVVTYTGDGTNNRSIAHNLGIAPGMIIVKNVTNTQSWIVYHRSNGTGKYMILNGTGAVSTNADAFPTVSSTAFVPTANQSAFALNTSGDTFVAYLFAHDTTSDGIIQCGSYTGNGSATGPTVTLGWEPQWLLVKDATSAWDWRIVDNMRGMPVGSGAASLFPNLTNAEFTTSTVAFSPTATGFQVAGSAAQINTSGNTYIYIAIRRGPMRTPTSGTSVFLPSIQSESGGATVATSFPVDMFIDSSRALNSYNMSWFDRLRGNSAGYLRSPLKSAEGTLGTTPFGNVQNGVVPGMFSSSPVQWLFRRAPSFFDEVCYSATGVSGQTYNHNLGVAPELMIVKKRDGSSLDGWFVYAAPLGATKWLLLNTTDASTTSSVAWNNTAPTSTVFTVSNYADVNNPGGGTYVNYLFASCPGVSKVGSYTGTGALQTINCGFTTGARFVLIKRTDSTGDWYVWDSARGITSGNDPYLLLNSTAAEVTTTNYVDTDTTGFQVTAAAPAGINASGGSYIFLAVA